MVNSWIFSFGMVRPTSSALNKVCTFFSVLVDVTVCVLIPKTVVEGLTTVPVDRKVNGRVNVLVAVLKSVEMI